MIKLTLILITLLLSASSGANTVQEEMLYSTSGYPYDLLIRKTDKVKIFYTQEDREISCKVQINWRNKENKVEETTTQHITVTNYAFQQKPLASCLPRKMAKSLLANIYA